MVDLIARHAAASRVQRAVWLRLGRRARAAMRAACVNEWARAVEVFVHSFALGSMAMDTPLDALGPGRRAWWVRYGGRVVRRFERVALV